MRPSKLFSDLASDARLSMLERLKRGDTSFTELQKIVSLSSPEVSRHLRRLTESRLIEKKSDRLYTLTYLGKMIAATYSDTSFIAFNAEYFSTHDPSPIPEHLLSRLDMLSECEIMPLYPALNKMYELNQSKTDFMWDVSDNMPLYQEINVLPSDLGSMTFKVIVTPALAEEMHSRYGDLIGQSELRTLNDIKFTVTITNYHAFLGLPGLDGMIDRNNFLFGQSSNYIQWSKDFFVHYWDKSTPFEPST